MPSGVEDGFGFRFDDKLGFRISLRIDADYVECIEQEPWQGARELGSSGVRKIPYRNLPVKDGKARNFGRPL